MAIDLKQQLNEAIWDYFHDVRNINKDFLQVEEDMKQLINKFVPEA